MWNHLSIIGVHSSSGTSWSSCARVSTTLSIIRCHRLPSPQEPVQRTWAISTLPNCRFIMTGGSLCSGHWAWNEVRGRLFEIPISTAPFSTALSEVYAMVKAADYFMNNTAKRAVFWEATLDNGVDPALLKPRQVYTELQVDIHRCF